ncbi:protein FAM162A isoform X1 [Sus scrofa]|uniref:protein FAM162A isoform X1 n=1 Tax=Sus scrofa TaxID=9823 RepID=UPI000A2B0306|nr:protein FAM162A isoform X1 [Sus scrofa]
MHDLHALRVTHAPPTTPRAKHDPSSRRPRPPVPLEALLSQRWVTLSTERSRTTAGLGLSAGPRSGRPWGASAACAWRLQCKRKNHCSIKKPYKRDFDLELSVYIKTPKLEFGTPKVQIICSLTNRFFKVLEVFLLWYSGLRI